MAKFFDPSDPAHLNLLLPVDLRKATELPQVVEEVESEILARFTRRMTKEKASLLYPGAYMLDYSVSTTDYSYVMLRGYATELEDMDPGLVNAMLLTEAAVIPWRLKWVRRDSAVHSQHTSEGKFIRWREDAYDRFPQDWDIHLRPFDMRSPAVYL
jgi:hypothetical protein